MSVTAGACAKCILCGEHFVVHGCPCIAFPVYGLETKVVLDKSDSDGIRVNVHGVSFSDLPKVVQSARETTRLLCEAMGRPDFGGLTVDVTGSMPVSQGFGSSASFSVALVRALLKYWHLALDEADILSFAGMSEKCYHKSPSGVDHSTIALEKLILFRDGQCIDTLRSGTDFRFVLASVGPREGTGSVIARVSQWKNQNPEAFQSMCVESAAISQRAWQSLKEGNAQKLGELLKQNQKLLAELGVSSPALNECIAAAESAGALGAKLTGAGAGGGVVALVDDEHLDLVIQSWKKLRLPFIYPIKLH